MDGLVAGKVALVTGAGSGIGRAAARALAREGARVAVADVDRAGGEETLAAIRSAGGQAELVACDVSRDAEVAAAVRSVVERWGRLDCAVNNAGVATEGGLLHQLTLEEWERTLAVNLSGVFYCMRHEIPVMIGQGGGAIVNTSSGAGVVAAPLLAHYCATKHGVLGLTKTAAQENARTGVRVNAILPGVVDTPMLQRHMAKGPLIEQGIRAAALRGSLGRPEEVAEAAVWLCSDRASLVSGVSLVLDGGALGR